MRGASLVAAVAALTVAGAACAASEPQRSQSRAPAAQERASLGLQRVVSGLQSPVHVTSTPSEPARLYIVEQIGRIRVLERGRLRVFLDIRSIVRSGGEQGLLSMAFHPKYAANRRFYVNYTDRNGDTRVVEYRSNGRRAVARVRQLLFVDQPYSNHNGGQLAFGPDGKLYIGMGDGGSGGDPENRAQNLGSLLGKMLTINVDRRGARPQIDALGLRNPWRFSFDRATGDLYVGDVGQGSWEEISYLPRARQRRLQNYGWDVFEGRARFEDKQRSRGDLISPIVVYANPAQGCSVTGGFVYRGSRMPGARGRYFYGDYCSGNVWSLKVSRGRATQVRLERFKVNGLTSFGEDARGELYLVAHGGTVYRLRP